MPQHLYAETLLTPGLGGTFQWRYQNTHSDLLDLIDRESPVYRALNQSIQRFQNTVFELSLNKPTLIEWANAQDTLQDTADRRELRLGGAHVFQQSIELLQGMQMMTDRTEDPVRLSAIHHSIGDVMGFIGQRSGSIHWLEQASLSYDQALEIRNEETTPETWAQTTYNLALVIQIIAQLEDDKGLLKQALQSFQQASTRLSRETAADDWAATLCSAATALYQLGVQRRGSRTLEQAAVAFRNVLTERTQDNNPVAWAITQNNFAATLQGLGEHEEDINSLESSIPEYEKVLKTVDRGSLPLVWAMVTANRASALLALARESDYLDMAESCVTEFESLRDMFEPTDYESHKQSVQQRLEQAKQLVVSLQV